MTDFVTLERDLLDTATLAVPSAVGFDAFLEVIGQCVSKIQGALPLHRVVPYGSFVSGLLL
jgi:hypothetical protein